MKKKSLETVLKRFAQAGMIALGMMTVAEVVSDSPKWNNPIKVEHIRDGKVIGVIETKNGIVDVGMNSLLDVTFRNQTQIATWYMGLVDNSGFTAFAAGDTMGSHAGWGEFTSYSEAVRQTWTPGAASARAIANGTAVEFSINGSGTVKGIFMTSNSTKSGTTGTLWATAAFTSTVAVTNGDVLKVTYTISG